MHDFGRFEGLSRNYRAEQRRRRREDNLKKRVELLERRMTTCIEMLAQTAFTLDLITRAISEEE